jgi:hypothetical protein
MHVFEENDNNDDLSHILNNNPDAPQKSFLMDVDFYKRQTSFRPQTLHRIRPIAPKASHTVLVRYDPLSASNIKEECKLDYKQSTNELQARGYRAIGELGK